MGAISRCPGIHVAQVARFLDLAPNTVLHHSSRLRNQGKVRQSKRDQRLHLFPASVPVNLENALIACRYGASGLVLQTLREDPGASLAAVMRRAGTTRRITSKAVGMLTEAGLLHREGHTHARLTIDEANLEAIKRYIDPPATIDFAPS